MYNLLISSGVAAIVFIAVAFFMHPVAAAVPALLVFGLLVFFLTRRVSRAVEAEMQMMMPLLQARKVSEAEAHVRGIKKKWGKWQFMLGGQLDAQLGMLDYLQMKWDEALPKFEKGTFQNWPAKVCIGCIHYRRERFDEAWAAFESAAKTAPKEAMIYCVWATLLTRAGKREKALEALTLGLATLENSKQLKELRKAVANKKKIKTKSFGEAWYQFFPEELATQQLMRGRKGQLPAHMQAPQQKIGSRASRRR
jgi:tetratricopeptide (TPR) repeat protein